MSKLAAIIKSLMREKDISVTELARQTQISQPVLHRLATGTTCNPQIETLLPIAGFFGISIDQLIGNAPLSNTLTTAHDWVHIPLLTLDQITNWLAQDPLLNLTKFVSTDSPTSKNSYAIQLSDSTMQPRFTPGTLLIIDPEYSPENQDFVMAQMDSQKIATFKQFLIDGESHYLKPLNPDFPIIKMNPNDRILGTMVQARIDYGKKSNVAR